MRFTGTALFILEKGIVVGSKPRQALLFMVVLECVSLVAQVYSRTQES